MWNRVNALFLILVLCLISGQAQATKISAAANVVTPNPFDLVPVAHSTDGGVTYASTANHVIFSALPAGFNHGNGITTTGGTLDTTQPADRTIATTSGLFYSSDAGKFIIHSNASANSMTLQSAAVTGWTQGYSFIDSVPCTSGADTITPTTSLINGGATLIVPPCMDAFTRSNGTDYMAGFWLNTPNVPTSLLSGNLAITNFNSGTNASSSTYWRGDHTWATPGAAGSDKQVQYNNNGSGAGHSGLTYNSSTSTLTAGSMTVTTAGTVAGNRIQTVSDVSTFGITIDGGGASPATGAYATITIPYAGTIGACYIAADQSGSAVIDLKRSGTSIVGGGGNKPTLSSAQFSTTTPSGWTSTAVAANDHINFNLDSVTTATIINLVCKLTRT